jgi:hypothetical protein
MAQSRSAVEFPCHKLECVRFVLLRLIRPETGSRRNQAMACLCEPAQACRKCNGNPDGAAARRKKGEGIGKRGAVVARQICKNLGGKRRLCLSVSWPLRVKSEDAVCA